MQPMRSAYDYARSSIREGMGPAPTSRRPLMAADPVSSMAPVSWESIKGGPTRADIARFDESRRVYSETTREYENDYDMAQRKRGYDVLQAERMNMRADHMGEARFVHMAQGAPRDMDLRGQDPRNGNFKEDDMAFGGGGRRGGPVAMAIDRRMEMARGVPASVSGMQRPPPPRMDSRGTGGGTPMGPARIAGGYPGVTSAPTGTPHFPPHKTWSEPNAKMARKEIEIIEEKKTDWLRKEEEERRRKLHEEEEEWLRKEEATRRKLQELERKEREIMEKERRLQEDIRRKEEERRIAEQRREEARRLEEIRMREEELLRKEERLKRIEMERQRAEEMMRLEEMDRTMRANQVRMQHHAGQSMMPRAVNPNWPGGYNGGGGHHHGVGYANVQQQHPHHRHPHHVGPGHHPARRPEPQSGRDILVRRDVGGPVRKADHHVAKAHGRGGVSNRSSAFNRLGPKMSVKARLGGVGSRQGGVGPKGMAITIKGGGGRIVGNSGGSDSYTTIDQVGKVDAIPKTAKELAAEQKEQEEIKERERKLKERLLKEQEEKKKGVNTSATPQPVIPNLDTVVIKRRSAAANKPASTTAGKTMTIKTPNNLVAKLAAKLKELPKPAVIPAQKSEQEKAQLKKKIKNKYKKSSLPEKILFLALENVAYDQSRAILLLNKMLKDDAPNKVTEVVTLDDENDENDEDKLDFEADEPEN